MNMIMGTMVKPQLRPIQIGGQFKTLEVTAEAGAVMPPHHCTSEAVVVVLEGEATLVMEEGDTPLVAGTSFLIPAGKTLTLNVARTFKATVIMGSNATLEFEGGK